MDSGGETPIDAVIYDGPLTIATVRTVFGGEEDDPQGTKSYFDRFEAAVRAADGSLALGPQDPQTDVIPFIFAVLGAILGFAIFGGDIVLSRTEPYRRPGEEGSSDVGLELTGGAGAGGLIGFVLGLVVSLIVEGLPPDPIIFDRSVLAGGGILTAVDGGVLPTDIPRQRVHWDDRYPIFRQVAWEGAGPGQIRERHVFWSENEESTYELRYLHRLDLV